MPRRDPDRLAHWQRLTPDSKALLTALAQGQSCLGSLNPATPNVALNDQLRPFKAAALHLLRRHWLRFEDPCGDGFGHFHLTPDAERVLRAANRARRPAPRGPMLPVFSGLDFFPEEPATPAPYDPALAAQRALEAQLHESPEYLDSQDLLRPAAQPLAERILRFRRARAWYVYAPTATTPEQAAKFGQRVQRGLIGLRNLRACDPGLHQHTLFVGFRDTFIELPPLTK